MRSLLYFLFLILVAACGRPSPSVLQGENPTADTPVRVAEIRSNIMQPEALYQEYCSGCHGEELRTFVNQPWKHGKSPEQVAYSIKVGYPDAGMPSYDSTFTDAQIASLTEYILATIQKPNIATEDASKDGVTNQSGALAVRYELVLDGIDIPWGIAFLPDNSMLVTEKSGKLYHKANDGAKREIGGVPAVWDHGQGGLLDVLVHPDFATNQRIYLSYSKETGDGEGNTAVHLARLVDGQLVGGKDIWVAANASGKKYHFGSRLVIDDDGYLFVSIGDRGDRDTNPQDITRAPGKIHRLHDDGRIPTDNPFYNTPNAVKSIWSYGHRNAQGLALHPVTRELWEHEHGPRGGDELNRITPGTNYGWPVISYGINYSGTKFTDITKKEGMAQPQRYWVPSIAPCGMDFVRGNKYPGWENSVLVGSLKFDYVSRCALDGNTVTEEEKIFEDIGRVRSLEVDRDGYIYVGVEEPGRVYKVLPL